MSVVSQPVTVLGAGSWGSALALLLARKGHRVTLWARDPAQVECISRDRVNVRYLPGHIFPADVEMTASLEAALAAANTVVIAVPSDGFEPLVSQIGAQLGGEARAVWATKGLDPTEGRLLHEIAAAHFGAGSALAVLSGPTFAREVAAGLPSAVTIASADPAFALELSSLFHTPRFRVYTSEDIAGVQVGGAIKNVLAIAAGIADGLEFGANARAALITRGLAELTRLGLALGARLETLIGLAGLGDLVLTCTDDQSRNRRFGLALGRGLTVAEAEQSIEQVVEGVRTTRQATRLAARHRVDMPIVAAVDRVLNDGVAPGAAVEALLAREPRAE